MEAAGWQQQHRVPAFGDWNYPRESDGAGGDWPVTPCFDDLASAMRRTAARPTQHKCNQRSRPSARRMRIPAFGEWNHHGRDGGSGNGDGTWAPAAVVTPFFDLAAATPQKAPRTVMLVQGKRFDDAVKLPPAADQPRRGHCRQTKRSKVADSGDYAAATRSCFSFVVPKAVDDDLYGVPPDMLYDKPARKDGWLRRILVLGCSCFCPPRERT